MAKLIQYCKIKKKKNFRGKNEHSQCFVTIASISGMFSSSFLPAPVKGQFCNTYKLFFFLNAKYFDSFFNQFGTCVEIENKC